MYKVFYNQRTVFFIENSEILNDIDNFTCHEYINKEILKTTIEHFLNSKDVENLIVKCHAIEQSFKEFSSLYKIIRAAGGAVKNTKRQTLFIYRRNKWDLPKGKIEKNETPELGAIREVEEECGITGLKIQKLLMITYHTYVMDDEEILKPTYWYEMHYSGSVKLKPQLEEEITKAEWLAPKDFSKIYENTFPSIIDVLGRHLD